MTNSYGLNPNLNNPSDIEGLPIDFRNTEGSSKCCQFFSDNLPPTWYYFHKENKTYSDARFGISKPPYGSWKSELKRLVTDTLPDLADLSTGFEVIENKTETRSVLHEKGVGTLNVIGTSRPSYGDAPHGINSTGAVVTPLFVGQTHIDNFGETWVAVDITSNTWHLLAMGAS